MSNQRPRAPALTCVAVSVGSVVVASLAGCSSARHDERGAKAAAATSLSGRVTTTEAVRSSTSTTRAVRSLTTPSSRSTVPPIGDTTTENRHGNKTTSSSPNPGPASQLRDADVGYSLTYPDGWYVRGQLVATEFATGARCRSVEVVDYQPPPDSGPAGSLLHSLVQVCARRLGDRSSLEEFMRQTYGNAFDDQFHAARVGDLPGYRSLEQDTSTAFLQTADHRLQIVTAVVAAPDKRRQRRAEVQEILDRVTFDS
jgi:hypothetical protein